MVATPSLSALARLHRQPSLSWTPVPVLFGFLVLLAIFAQNVTSQTLKQQESQHLCLNYPPLQILLVAKTKNVHGFLAPKFSPGARNVTPLLKTAPKPVHLTYFNMVQAPQLDFYYLKLSISQTRRPSPVFLSGCSLFSIRQPEGIAGFGRSPESLPSQLGLKKFSYCLVSHAFDDSPASSDLVLDTGSGSGDTKTPGLSYTRFQKNPTTAFPDYYYVLLRNIFIGDTHVKLPYKFLVPGSDGNGGTIVDSGTTFTFMEKPVYELVAQEFEKQMTHYTVATEVQNHTGLRPCFNISGEKSVSAPELIFQFKGGAKMALPTANYFSFVDSGSYMPYNCE
ncbi:hypothetical protein OIU77_030978 [Salix suchowensis]|uniref:Peptidase A1 domain-containing protein n=1 Tax=Salix suchowensis TaxID=1278906 RepID=A0ABQ9BGG6_9ROSI|nr:hypothetical protein OIU77_030978 [Salix suchowensis]